MCGRFTLAKSQAELAESFPGVDFAPLSGRVPPRYNIAPSQPVVAILADDPARAEFLQWGLVPHWAKDPAGRRMINARAESLAQKPSFRESFRKRRCLVPADGFYEWGKDPGRPGKIPWYFRLRTGGLFAFAGLWDRWRSWEQELFSCAIVTTGANSLIAAFHERMPVILPPSRYREWLDPEEDTETLRAILRPFPAEEMTAWKVSRAVNDPRVDEPGLIQAAVGREDI